MSDLNPKYPTIKLGEKEYGMLFDLNAIDAIQDQYDIPISELPNLISDGRNVFKVLKFMIATLINEAIDDSESGEEHVTEKFVGRKITPENVPELKDTVLLAFVGATPKTKSGEDEEDGDKGDPNEKSV
jgi:hypothetical protein